jgi:hypothetical protein
MTNVVSEIINEITQQGFETKDISWIGSKDGQFAMSYDDFYMKFGNMEYDNGFGAQELASDLVMVMKDNSYFDRDEYDGAEGWTYNKPPQKQKDSKTMEHICVKEVSEIGWRDLKDLNKETTNCKFCGNLMLDDEYSKGECYSCKSQRELEEIRQRIQK